MRDKKLLLKRYRELSTSNYEFSIWSWENQSVEKFIVFSFTTNQCLWLPDLVITNSTAKECKTVVFKRLECRRTGGGVSLNLDWRTQRIGDSWFNTVYPGGYVTDQGASKIDEPSNLLSSHHIRPTSEGQHVATSTMNQDKTPMPLMSFMPNFYYGGSLTEFAIEVKG